jgi:hypothetical protein
MLPMALFVEITEPVGREGFQIAAGWFGTLTDSPHVSGGQTFRLRDVHSRLGKW